MYEVHWKTTDIRAGKLIGVTVPAMNGFSGTPLKFASVQGAHEWARDLFRQCKTRFPYTVQHAA